MATEPPCNGCCTDRHQGGLPRALFVDLDRHGRRHDHVPERFRGQLELYPQLGIAHLVRVTEERLAVPWDLPTVSEHVCRTLVRRVPVPTFDAGRSHRLRRERAVERHLAYVPVPSFRLKIGSTAFNRSDFKPVVVSGNG